MGFGKVEENFCRWMVEFDKRKRESFCKWEEGHFDNRLECNKPCMDFGNVENDLGMMMIFSWFSSPHKKQLTHLLFSF